MATEPIVSCRRLTCGYGGRAVVRDVDLTVERGQILMILGGSGSGKSTLLKTLAGTLPPLSGEVRLLGEDPYALEPEQRRLLHRRAGMLYQNDALFASMSVLDNVCIPPLELTELPKEVIALLARSRLALLGVLDIEHQYPAEISGGQSKRVALARATVLDPEVLFCDEPTTGLDPPGAAYIDALLTHFRDVLRMAIVAVTHDVASVRAIADRAIVLVRGRIAAEGTFQDLENNPDPSVQALLHRTAPPGALDSEESARWRLAVRR